MSEERSIWQILNTILSEFALDLIVVSNASFENFNDSKNISFDVTDET